MLSLPSLCDLIRTIIVAVTVGLIVMVTSGCTTRLYERDDQGFYHCVASIQGDATNVNLRTARGTVFHADVINHSNQQKQTGITTARVAGSAAGAAATVFGPSSAVAGLFAPFLDWVESL